MNKRWMGEKRKKWESFRRGGQLPTRCVMSTYCAYNIHM